MLSVSAAGLLCSGMNIPDPSDRWFFIMRKKIQCLSIHIHWRNLMNLRIKPEKYYFNVWSLSGQYFFLVFVKRVNRQESSVLVTNIVSQTVRWNCTQTMHCLGTPLSEYIICLKFVTILWQQQWQSLDFNQSHFFSRETYRYFSDVYWILVLEGKKCLEQFVSDEFNKPS